MPESPTVYTVTKRGAWNRTYTLALGQETAGVLTVQRNGWGMVVAGKYVPAKGEVLHFRRDPGLLRSQFSLWTEGREWLGSSLRWSFARREIVLHTGSKPLKVLPLPGLTCGWSLQAPRTGEMARIYGQPLAARAKIEVYRKVEFEQVVFAFFLASQLWLESIWPGPAYLAGAGDAPAPSNKAAS
jgi:hypothetical protein